MNRLRHLAWFPVLVFVHDHLFAPATISGRSMQPTFNPDSSQLTLDRVILNKYPTTLSLAGRPSYAVNDVITLYSPTDPSTLLTKRIIALPGALVQTLPLYPERYVRIPKGFCWVEGDESFHSRDSNTFGPIPLALIHAKVSWIFWPPQLVPPSPPLSQAFR